MTDVSPYLVGGAIGALFTAFLGLVALYPRVQRLEQWAWGPTGRNGIDWTVKELARDHKAHLLSATQRESMQERRNIRQHPNDPNRAEDTP